MAKMKVAKFDGEGILNFREVNIPKAEKGNQVVIKVIAAAICGTDLHILAIPQSHPCDVGTTIGHECIAEVFEVGPDVTEYKLGDRVAVDPIIPCGACKSCKDGSYNMCESLTALGVQVDGVFAPYCLTTADKLHRVSEKLPVKEAVFIEMLSCVMNGVKRLNMLPGKSVAVLGAGPIGLVFASVMRAFGAGKVIISDALDSRLDFARKNAAADLVVDVKKENLKERINEVLPAGVDIVIDTVGTLFKDTIEIAANEGQILLFGINDQYKNELMQYDITRKELTIVASYATHNSFPIAINMLTTGVIKLEPLLTHVFELKDLQKGIDVCNSGEGIKVAILMDEKI